MPAQSLNSEMSDPISMAMPAAWPTLTKSSPKKNVMETKPAMESKKICICSPTSHAGSFRCHLHRASSATQNSSCCQLVAKSSTIGMGNRLNTKSQGGYEPILSRFGRASSVELKSIPESSLPCNNNGL